MDSPSIKYTTWIGIYRWSSDANVPFDQQTNRKSFGIGDTRTGAGTWGSQIYTPGRTPINLMVKVYAERYLVGTVQANIQD